MASIATVVVKATGETREVSTQSPIQLDAASTVRLRLDPDRISTVSRAGANGEDLVVVLDDGQEIVVSDYFVTHASGELSELVLEDEAGALWWLQTDPQTGGFLLAGDQATMPVASALTASSGDGAAALAGGATASDGVPALGIGLGLGALALGVAAAGGGGGSSGSAPTPPAPPPPDTIPPDTTPPPVPTAQINASGTVVTGTAEAGSTVSIVNEAGTLVGSGEAAADGSYTITLDPPQTSGGTLRVTATDAAGNVSGPATVTAPDLSDVEPPASPSAVITAEGDAVNGIAEPGSTVTVYDADGNVLGSAVAGPDGQYTVILDPAVTAGEALTITATDAAGNESPPTTLTAPDLSDTVAPEPPTAVINAAGDTVSGTAEAGATVDVRDADGNIIGSGVAGTDGRYAITLDPPLTAGETLTVTATDAAGNESDPVLLTAPDLTDATAPDAPTAVISAAGDTITGTAEVGATVNVYDTDGSIIGTGVAGTDGRYTITLEPPLTAGEALTVTATDAAGNESAPIALTAPDLTDTTAPETPTAVINSTGDTVSGTAEAGAAVNVYDADGNIIGTGVADTSGRYSITLDPALTAGEALTVTATDAGGNESAPIALTAPDLTDTTAPETPTAVINAAGDTVSGTAEAGATINVYDADGNVIGTGLADTSGRYSITLDPALTAGEALTVTAADAAGNESDPVALTAPDLTDTSAPAPPTAAISAAGDSVTGLAEPGSTVTIRDADDAVIGTGTAGTNGRYTILLEPALVGGEVVTVTATDAAGNESLPTSATAPNLDNDEVPVSPTATVSATGDAITGIAEPGTTVIIRDADGNELGRVPADATTGAYSFALAPPLTGGEQLSVTAENATGESFPTTVFAPDLGDTEAPLPPTAVINDAGDTVTGIAEQGATVEVRNADGEVLSSDVAGTDGRYTIILDPPLTAGETLGVVAIDGSGNVSDPTTLTAPDLSDSEAPSPPTAVINDAGDTITGIAEAGTRVEVRDTEGELLGSGAAGTDGRYTISLDPPLTGGETLEVTAIDATGNVSDPTSLTAPDLSDTEAPSSPTAVINDAGDTVTGVAEAGARVEVRAEDGALLGTEVAGTNGRYTITLDPPLTGGETLEVRAIDGAGNVSDPTTLTAPDLGDTEAPLQPTAVINDAGDTVTGIAEPGATVEVRDADGEVLGNDVAGTDGRYTITLVPPLTSGETLEVVAIDGSGNESEPTTLTAPNLGDTEAPLPPTAVINDIGDTVTGIAEPGVTVEVRDADGDVIGSDVAGSDGRYTITLDPPLTSGETLEVVAIDGSGNESEPTTLTAPDLGDTEAPLPPTAVINDAGDTVTGIAEPGATVEVRDADGEVLGSDVAGTDGRYTIILVPPLTSGETLDVVAIDGSGNESEPTTLTAPDLGDAEGPLPPTAVITAAGDMVSGNTEAGATVEVRDAGGTVIGSAVAATDGRYLVMLEPPQTEGQVLTVNAVDAAGNRSGDTTITAPDLTDNEAPDAPTAAINATGDVVTGLAEVGATVTVYDADGAVIGTGVAGTNGRYEFTITPPQVEGQTLEVTATDAAGNESAPTSVLAPTLSDTENPDAPTATINAAGDTVTGLAEPGSTVQVFDVDGNELGSDIAAADGSYSIGLDPALTSGEQLSVTARDAEGNTSFPTTIFAPDLTDSDAPDAPTAVINGAGNVVTGVAEPGAIVEVRDANDVVIGTSTAATDGRYTIVLDPALTAGETIEVTARDAADNVSEPTVLTAPDLTDTDAPEAPTAVISAAGDTVSGTTEAGARVDVLDGAGNVIGSAFANGNGLYTATLAPAQTSGQTLEVTATDAAGNTSEPTTITAPVLDNEAPDAPVAVISADGATVSGTAEPGSTVRVFDANEVELGAVDADPNGEFTIPLTPPRIAGEALSVTATDDAGNVSPPTQLTAPVVPDTEAPLPPVADISADGATVSGTAEALSLVRVRNVAGTVIGSGVANSDGAFSITLNPPLIDSEALTVTAQDAAGNESEETPLVAPDLTAPDAPVAEVNEEGTLVTGTAESGSLVTVYDEAKNALGSIEATNGTYSIVLSPALTGGERLLVTATDDAGNESTATAINAPNPDGDLFAYDKIAEVDLDIVPTTTDVALGSAGYLALVSVNALNLQANVNLLGTPSVGFTVEAGHSLDAVFDYSALLTAGVLGNYQVVVQRWDGARWTGVGGTGEATLLELNLLTGTASAEAELGPGQYRAFMTFNGLGIGVLGALSVGGVESDFTAIADVDGAPIIGNVITDDGGDVVTPGTVVQSVNGIDVVSDGTTIAGAYGTLTINPDGSYTYVPTGSAQDIGQVDAFTYTIANGSTTATATLYVRIDSNDVALTWDDSNPGAPATFDFAVTDDAALAGVEFANATGDVFDATGAITLALFNTNQTFNSQSFTVTDTMDVFGTATISSVVALLGSGAIALQQQTATGWTNVVQVPYTVLLGVAAPLASIDLASLDLGPGTYRFSARASGAVGLQVSVNIDVNAVFLDQFVVDGSDSGAGNLLANDALGSDFTTLQISDGAGGWIDIRSGEPTTIQGDFGSLAIDASGNYVYTPSEDTGHFTTLREDVFGYRLLHPSGQTSDGELVVTVEPTGAGAQVNVEAFDLEALAMDEAANDADGMAEVYVDVDVTGMFASAGEIAPLMVRGEGDEVIALDAPRVPGSLEPAAWDVDYAVPMRHEDDTDALLQQQSMSAV